MTESTQLGDPLFERRFSGVAARSLLILSLFSMLFSGEAALAFEPPKRIISSVMVQGVPNPVHIPKGYRLELLTDELSSPRMLTFAQNGDLLIGSRSGAVYHLAPPYRDPRGAGRGRGLPA